MSRGLLILVVPFSSLASPQPSLADLQLLNMSHDPTLGAQQIISQHCYRPPLPEVEAKHMDEFTPVNLLTIDEVFGGWKNAQATHFADGGVFKLIDQGGK